MSTLPLRSSSLLHRRTLGALALLVLAPASQAGNVLRVGAGQPFGDIQSAVNAAARGDLVLVEPGSYPSFRVGAAGAGPTELAIVASGGSFSILSTPAPNAGPEILVENVPLGDEVTILGARIDFDDDAHPAVRVRNCPGSVRLGRLVIDYQRSLVDAGFQAAVEVERTATFWLIDSSVWGFNVTGSTAQRLVAGGLENDGISGLQLVDSQAVIESCRLRGFDNATHPATIAEPCGGDALRLIGESSSWLLKDVGGAYLTVFQGGEGYRGGHALHQVRTPVDLGLNKACSGDEATPVYAPGRGTGPGLAYNGGYYAYNNSNGLIRGAVGIVWVLPEICGKNMRNELTLATQAVPVGGTLVVEVETWLARRYVLGFGEGARYRAHTPGLAGRAVLEPSTIRAVVSGTTAARTARVLGFPVPASASLLGLQLTLQAAVGPVGGALDALSLPALAVLVP